jgi:hypothetical protein
MFLNRDGYNNGIVETQCRRNISNYFNSPSAFMAA